MMKRSAFGVFFGLAAVGLAGNAAATERRPGCDLSSQPYHNYQVELVPSAEVVTPRKYIIHAPNGRTTITKGHERRFQAITNPHGCDPKTSYEFYVRAGDYAQAGQAGVLHLSTNLVHETWPAPVRACLSVPVRDVSARKGRDGDVVIRFVMDETKNMQTLRQDMDVRAIKNGVGGPSWCHSIKLD